MYCEENFNVSGGTYVSWRPSSYQVASICLNALSQVLAVALIFKMFQKKNSQVVSEETSTVSSYPQQPGNLNVSCNSAASNFAHQQPPALCSFNSSVLSRSGQERMPTAAFRSIKAALFPRNKNPATSAVVQEEWSMHKKLRFYILVFFVVSNSFHLVETIVRRDTNILPIFPSL
jgi:hypothetical protein